MRSLRGSVLCHSAALRHSPVTSTRRSGGIAPPYGRAEGQRPTLRRAAARAIDVESVLMDDSTPAQSEGTAYRTAQVPRLKLLVPLVVACAMVMESLDRPSSPRRFRRWP